MLDDIELFGKYTDPQRAHRVLQAYLRDISGYGLEVQAEALVAGCRTPDELDARLDVLISGERLTGDSHMVSHRKRGPDAD